MHEEPLRTLSQEVNSIRLWVGLGVVNYRYCIRIERHDSVTSLTLTIAGDWSGRDRIGLSALEMTYGSVSPRMDSLYAILVERTDGFFYPVSMIQLTTLVPMVQVIFLRALITACIELFWGVRMSPTEAQRKWRPLWNRCRHLCPTEY
jgi:hypothetical protein